MQAVKERKQISFVYCDVNCRLKVKFCDKREEFFNSIKDLNDILNR